MGAGLDSDSPLEQALAGGKPQRAGRFRLYFDGEHCEWSPEVERLHGYEPGTVSPPPPWCCHISIPRTTSR
jgi:hypothetical protein